jgi:hypothetical protein
MKYVDRATVREMAGYSGTTLIAIVAAPALQKRFHHYPGHFFLR